jgi:putative component of toxin-antitoxin plasmid stabilization module
MMTIDDRKWIETHFEKLNDRIAELRVEIAMLKVKAGTFGLIGGVIPIAVMLCIYWITKK